jgi:sRNA-binding regulator protein Hfq
MPREVFAEEIEQFLGTLDGVASARVFTTHAGEISQVYVTAENSADSRAIRRGVGAALVSAYGLPVEPWRIQVTQLRDGLRPTEIPHFGIVRIEESVSAGEITATVQIAWVRGGEKKVATGRARGTPGPATRQRTLAAAAVEAVRDALEPAHRGVSLRGVLGVTFLDRPAVLVGISISTPGGPETSLGIAQQEGVSEPAVLAVLDAVTKWFLRSAQAADATQTRDRRWQLEVMRHFVRSTERPESLPPHDVPGPARESSMKADSAAPHESAPHPDAVLEVVDIDTLSSRAEPSPPPRETAGNERGLAGTAEDRDPDVIYDLSDIRPEKRGGSAMSVHQEPSRAGALPSRGAHASMEDSFYQTLVAEQTPIQVRCRDGYEVLRAVLKDVGTYTLLLETSGGLELVYKHAVISIRPLTAPAAQA